MNATTDSGGKNTIRIDVGSSPQLKDYFSRKPDGEKCVLEIELIKLGMTGDVMEGTVVSMAPEGMDEEKKPPMDGKPGGEVEPSGEEPLMVSIGKASGY